MTGIKLVIAVTDGDWFEMLRQHPDVSEVNFRAPSAVSFRALKAGDIQSVVPYRSSVAPVRRKQPDGADLHHLAA